MLNFALCDDNSIILDKLDKMLNSLFFKHNIEACISYKTKDGNSLLNFINENNVSVVFLDIDLKSNISRFRNC